MNPEAVPFDHQQFASRKAEASVRLREMHGEEISEAHSFTHLSNVAGLTQVVGSLYEFSPHVLDLALYPGFTHDLVRSSSEDHDKLSDEEATADGVVSLLKKERTRGKIDLSDDELGAIHFAIANHSNFPSMFGDPVTRNEMPETLADKLHVAVFVADKLEANGSRVIARRSGFVAGDRLQEGGDWQGFGFRPKSSDYTGDEQLVVALESMIRMGFKNPKDIYPDRLKPLVDPLYGIQEEFFLGVCKASGFTIEGLADKLVNTRNENGRSILEASGVKNAPADAAEVAEIFKRRSGLITESIVLVDDDLANSAREAVDYFSARYRDDLDAISLSWDPQGGAAKKWHTGMIGYGDGTWVKDIKKQFNIEV